MTKYLLGLPAFLPSVAAGFAGAVLIQRNLGWYSIRIGLFAGAICGVWYVIFALRHMKSAITPDAGRAMLLLPIFSLAVTVAGAVMVWAVIDITTQSWALLQGAPDRFASICRLTLASVVVIIFAIRLFQSAMHGASSRRRRNK